MRPRSWQSAAPRMPCTSPDAASRSEFRSAQWQRFTGLREASVVLRPPSRRTGATPSWPSRPSRSARSSPQRTAHCRQRSVTRGRIPGAAPNWGGPRSQGGWSTSRCTGLQLRGRADVFGPCLGDVVPDHHQLPTEDAVEFAGEVFVQHARSIFAGVRQQLQKIERTSNVGTLRRVGCEDVRSHAGSPNASYPDGHAARTRCRRWKRGEKARAAASRTPSRNQQPVLS